MKTISEYLAGARNIVVKIGSAVLADKNGLDTAMISALAGQLARVVQSAPGRKVIVVSSGAVAAGRGVLAGALGGNAGGNSQAVRQALAAIGQGSLMRCWTDALASHGLVAAQALLTREDFHSRGRFQHMADAFAEMLAWNVVPIVNENDTVAVHELKFGDNDTLASLLVNMVESDLFINLTSAAGVKSANPESNPDAPILARIENIRELDIVSLCGARTALGSGGMHSKLLAARRVAQLGVPTLILPGRRSESLVQAFGIGGDASGQMPGTWIMPDSRAIPRRKFWLAYQSEPAGEVRIDDGASVALQEKGASLLPGGIISVSGEFEEGALLRVCHGREIIGVGFSNYSADSLRKIHGRKRHEISAILGDAKYPDVIHRDNLLLDAALPIP